MGFVIVGDLFEGWPVLVWKGGLEVFEVVGIVLLHGGTAGDI